MPYNLELSCALEAARAAGSLQLKQFEKNVSVEKKLDKSPVTDVDRCCEQVIYDKISKAFPEDGFLGEETGDHPKQGNRRWIVDPLDGTRPYIRGIPTFSVLIALEEDDIPVMGVIHLPAMNLTCWASKGSGAFLNEQPIHVSATTDLHESIGSGLGFLEKADTPEGQKLFSFMRLWDYAYGFMDAYSYVCVASGKLDLCINLLDKPWDCAAGACIVQEAGGRFSDIHGEKTIYNGSIILSNGKLHESAVNHFLS